jgi:hypothetical protein
MLRQSFRVPSQTTLQVGWLPSVCTQRHSRSAVRLTQSACASVRRQAPDASAAATEHRAEAFPGVAAEVVAGSREERQLETKGDPNGRVANGSRREHPRLLRCLPSGLTTQGSGVRGRGANLSSGMKHARPRIRCSRLLGPRRHPAHARAPNGCRSGAGAHRRGHLRRFGQAGRSAPGVRHVAHAQKPDTAPRTPHWSPVSVGLTPQGSVVRGRRARLASGRNHARPRIPCSRLLGRAPAPTRPTTSSRDLDHTAPDQSATSLG